MTKTDSRPLSASVRRGALWNMASTLVLRLANICLTAVVAHILSPRDFGVFAVALTAFAIVSALGELGVASCLIRADLDIDSLAPTMATVSFATSAVLAGAMAVFSKPIAAALGSPYAAGPVRVMALAVILTGVFAVPSAQLVRDFKQDKLFLANAISFIPSTVVLLLLARTGGGAMAFAWSRVVGQLAVGCVVFASVPRIYRPGITRSALLLLLRFGLPLAGANFVNYILLNVDYALVGHLMGAVALGTYVLAFNVASWPSNLLGTMINNVAMPAFTRVKHDADLLRDAIAGSLRGLSLVVFPMCSVTMALARPLVLTLYGAKWAAAASVLSILTLYSAISVICLLFANIIAGMGRTKLLLAVQLIWLVALAPAMAFGVHRDGIVGAAFAHIAVIGPIVLPCYLFALKRITGIRFALLAKAIVPALLASSAAALAARGATLLFNDPLMQLIAGLSAGGLIYLVAVSPQLITLLGEEKATELRAMRILRPYNAVARMVGLPAGNLPERASESGGRHGQQIAGLAIGDHPTELVTGAEWWQDVLPRQAAAVIAARYPAGLADAYDQYAVPLYGYCQWMLHEPTDAADVVEHTFVAAATEFGDLGDPGELRPRLYAMARDECVHRLGEVGYPWQADAVSQPANFSGDARRTAAWKLIRASLVELKPRQREVLELSLRHHLNDADLAVVLGVPWSQAHALSSRARSQFDNALRAYLVTRTGREACPWLEELLAGWDGQLTAQIRDMVGLHVEQCPACAGYRRRALRPEALFSMLPAATPPPELRQRVFQRCAGVTRDTPMYHQQVTQPIELLPDSWFPPAAGSAGSENGRRNRRVAAIAVAAALAVAVVVGASFVLLADSHPAPALAVPTGGGTSAPASARNTVKDGRPAKTRPSKSSSPRHRSRPSVGAVAPTAAPLASPTEQVSPSPSSSRSPSASPSSSPKPSKSASASPSRSPSPSATPSSSPPG